MRGAKVLVSFIVASIITGMCIGCESSKEISSNSGEKTESTEESNSKEVTGEIKELTEEEKVEDFEYLYKTIKENYPYLEVNKRLNNVDWLANKDEYLQRIKDTKDDGEFLNVLNGILGDLHNGHTQMINSESDFEYYRELYTKVDGWQHEVELESLNNKKALERYNIEEDNSILDKTKNIINIGEGSNGDNDNYVSASVRDIVPNKVGCITVPQMLPDYKMKNDVKLIDEYLEKVKDYQALVIDIRDNCGGSTNYWQKYLLPKIVSKDYKVKDYSFFKDGDNIKKFMKATGMEYGNVDSLDTSSLKNLPEEIIRDFKYYYEWENNIKPSEDSIKFKGNLYLLVNGSVYSASEALATFTKQTGLATIIGERTGGDGIGSDPILDMLPNSGYIFRFTKEMGVTTDGTCDEEFKTEPDYVVCSSKFDYINDDKCVQKVLELEKIK